LPNHYHRAMITYLDHPECWKGAIRFYHADTLSYWRKRKNMGHKPAAVDDESMRELAAQIRNYFHRTEGRGNSCIVEPFRRGELDYFFAARKTNPDIGRPRRETRRLDTRASRLGISSGHRRAQCLRAGIIGEDGTTVRHQAVGTPGEHGGNYGGMS